MPEKRGWERWFFAIMRGAVKGVPVAGGIAEELLRVFDEERSSGLAVATLQASAGGLPPTADLDPHAEAQVEAAAHRAWRALPEGQRAAFTAAATDVAAAACSPAASRKAQEFAEHLTRALLTDRGLAATLTPGAADRDDAVTAALMIRDPRRGTLRPCVQGQRLVVGRADPNTGVQPDLVCDDPYVSRRHCTLVVQPDGRALVTDTSSHGIKVNGAPVQGTATLGPGDQMTLGHEYTLLFEAPPVPAPAQAPRATRTGAGPLERIGKYRVVRELGRGGMGVVYEAVHLDLPLRVAIKVLLAGGKAGDDLVARFRREAMLGARLAHPGIVAVTDMGRVEETCELYCVMQFVEGESLRKRIQAGLDWRTACGWVVQVAEAVAYAHAQGVVHRDLKPDNVLITPDGQARLADFGIAKALDDGSGLTATGIALGTPNYMAPEQVESARRVEPSADVYGLGGILYTALTRRMPFEGKGVQEVLDNVREGRLVPPRDRDPSIPAALDALCRCALARRPEDRPASAAAFADALRAALEPIASLGPLPAAAGAQAPLTVPPPPAASPPAARPRVVAGKYQLCDQLGEGAFGTVWRARHALSGQELAVKLLKPSATDTARARFLREVTTSQAFVHKLAVQVRDCGEEPDGTLYLTMDLVRGETLGRRLARSGGRLSAHEVRQLGIQVVDVLREAHAAGIVHRDLKPDNVMVEERSGEPVARVLDFGIAKALDGTLAQLTGPGVAIGTVRYMSPEQAFGQRVDGRSDLYSLATVLYEALAGAHPLGDSRVPVSQFLRMLAAAPPRPLGEVAPGVEPLLAGAVMRNLAKRPEDRDPDAAAFRRALDMAAIAAPPDARPLDTSSGSSTRS